MRSTDLASYEAKDVTGVYSRAALNVRLQQIIQDAQENKKSFALLLLDLDHFKSVNDAFGHSFGDRVLSDFARRLIKFSRASDLVFRYGGDEFVILLQDASKTQAVSIASRLLVRISEESFNTSPPLSLTISVGVVSYPQEGQSAEELFEVADQRHYIAKRTGRGRVVSENPAITAGGLEALAESPSRLIDRDQALETLNRFLAQMPQAGRGMLTIFGVPGSGKSRFLSEARKIARLQGYALLPIRGTLAVKNRVYGALDIARQEIENLPAPSNGLQAFSDAIRQSLVDKGNAGLLVTVNNLNRIDHFTLEYLGTLFSQNIHPICILYASEDVSKSTDALRQKLVHDAALNESVTLTPISAAGLRIWLRQSLHWEAPRAFIEWFQHETGGLPSRIKRGIQYILDHSVIRQTSAGREIQFDYQNLHLDAHISNPAPNPAFNFPTGNTAFIGREDELRSIKQLLMGYRLVTLMGPGGSGKSRLAMQAALELVERFPDGVYFVPLASLSEPDYLVNTLASFLQLPLAGSQNPREKLINSLRQKNLLVVLDNFENLVQGADLLSEILEQTSGTRILVTSRQRLDLPEEMLMELSGLKFPEPGSPEDIEKFNAVQLFVLSAQRSRSDFTLTPENRPHVARICHIVGGMPLGIELAAAWTQTFEPEQIADKIEESLSFLATDPSGKPDPQRSIQAVLASFWDSLSNTEQEIVCRLSVFKNRFTESSARKVAGASPFFLEALVARSFLRKAPRGRFEMHGLLRQFASDQLARAPAELQTTLARHCAYYTDFLQQRSTAIRQGRHCLDEIDQEIDNIRAAWGWALQNYHANTLAQCARTLQIYYNLKGFMLEGLHVFQAAVDVVKQWRGEENDPAIDALYVELLVLLAGFYNWVNNYEKTSQVIEEAYPIAAELNNQKLLGEVLLVWGQRLIMVSDHTAARLKMDKALECARQAGDLQLEADVLRSQGNLVLELTPTRPQPAGDYYRKSLELCHSIGDQIGEAAALNNLGLVCLYQDDFQGAIDYFERNILIARQLGDRLMESFSLSNLGGAKIYTHEYMEAYQYTLAAEKISYNMGSPQDEGLVESMLGSLLMCSGNLAEAHPHMDKGINLLRQAADQANVCRILTDVALLYLFEGHNKLCLQQCEESLAISQELGLLDSQSLTLVVYGRAWFNLGELDKAGEAFQKEIEVDNQLGREFYTVEGLAGLARVQLKRGKLPLALKHVEDILALFDARQAEGQFKNAISALSDEFEVFLACHDVLKVAKDPRASVLLENGGQLLLEFATHSGDSIYQQNYLHGLPSHQQLLDLYEAAQNNPLIHRLQ